MIQCLPSYFGRPDKYAKVFDCLFLPRKLLHMCRPDIVFKFLVGSGDIRFVGLKVGIGHCVKLEEKRLIVQVHPSCPFVSWCLCGSKKMEPQRHCDTK